ncbi:BREX-1 system adenine-specific DNA-methyltransferase PglX [Levilactobacillus namurensis]|uniref:site-specific DNA-methyltransferase (adenine-specific) n=1 Tax=Levilactobacillus namurensis TaxID=380393 RepID=A0AAW8W469_9LACO|nr:BREX-1 system adenine-specific DNA-methyltransferase PglX [Levilactobacillus namurensis]MDT7013340.1 BREX-1 system adenine-specific DNA-methyltransferase PglX [Levilactobacillus namurensis]
MDKTAIKKFAVAARRDLIEQIKLKARAVGITAEGPQEKAATSTHEIEYYQLGNMDEQHAITGKDIVKRQELATELQQRAQKTTMAAAFNDLVEEVAYTWFNRIIAIRFMEVNGYLPSRTRVLSSTLDRNEPDIMVVAMARPDDLNDSLGGFSDAEKRLIDRARETEQPTDMDALYRMLFIKQANALNQNLPYLFEPTDDYAELLFTPSYNDGVIRHLIEDVDEADFDVTQGGQVEIIGWLYQYYNTEPHNQVVNISGGPVQKQDIPAATQLFTTDWVVKYMVDNSLGKYWSERHPDSSLRDKLAYQLPSQIDQVSDDKRPEDLKIIDNAMGSGHILVYAFDVLLQIYLEEGYSSREAAKLILQKNLYGLEIDRRAYQLAYFALMMKARQYNRRILTDSEVTPHVYVFEDTDAVSEAFLSQFPSETGVALQDVVSQFSNARELGSIINLDEQNYDWDALIQAVKDVTIDDLDVFNLRNDQALLLRTLTIAQVMTRHYDVAVTNPPYMNKMDKALKKYVKRYYADYASDLFSVFIYRNSQLVTVGGYSAFMTPFVWMFIKTYEKLRRYLIDHQQIDSLIQMEYSAFEEATVPINTFVLKNVVATQQGTYLRLSAFKGGMAVQRDKVLEAIANPDIDYLYRTNQANFTKIPGMPIAYWASENLLHDFEVGTRMDELAAPHVGLQTGNNTLFLRQWFEVQHSRINFQASSLKDAEQSGKKWFPYNKGGSYRKWYGNYDYVVNWEDNGYEIRHFTDSKGKVRSRPQNTDYYFHEAITWSLITSGNFSMRYREHGSIHDVSGMSVFSTNSNNLKIILGIMNSPVGNYIFKIVNPTINLQIGNVTSFPVMIDKVNDSPLPIIDRCIYMEKEDWNSREISWNFGTSPLLTHIADEQQNKVAGKLQNAFQLWQSEAQNRFDQLKANEEALNRIFIDLYGLNDELSPEVADKDVSVRLADETRDIKSFLSYFVGVVFGRYSLDVPGLAFAGGQWDDGKYQSFIPNQDNLLVLTDADYFGDSRDVIYRLREFLTATFGAATVDENLAYIATALGKKGTSPEDVIRKYFVDDFFKDHNKLYQKRPIYWEFSTGRNNGFKALMYLHRYEASELAMVRTDYLHALQGKYETRLEQLTELAANEPVISQKKRYEKARKHLDKQLQEVQKYDAPLQHLASQRIELDLDDGVLVNHQKLQGDEKILTKIK